MEDLVEECRENCNENEARLVHPKFAGPDEVLERVFTEDPIMWVRVSDYQIESLKLISQRVLKHLPHYQANAHELEQGLKVRGELGAMGFTNAFTLFFITTNIGAPSVAEEIQKSSQEGNGAAQMEIKVANEIQELHQVSHPSQCALLLYLNEDTFPRPSQDNETRNTHCQLVEEALDKGIPLALVHEQDQAKKACTFSDIMRQTPDVLKDGRKHKLYDTLAVPLYPRPEHRRVSLRQILKGLGAGPLPVRLHAAEGQLAFATGYFEHSAAGEVHRNDQQSFEAFVTIPETQQDGELPPPLDTEAIQEVVISQEEPSIDS
jgi:hypothetical protein